MCWRSIRKAGRAFMRRRGEKELLSEQWKRADERERHKTGGLA